MIARPGKRATIRVLAALVLGYFATAGLAALITVTVTAVFGVSRLDAFMMIGSFSWIAWSLFALWAIAARRLGLMLLLMGGLAIGGHLAAIALESALPVTGTA